MPNAPEQIPTTVKAPPTIKPKPSPYLKTLLHPHCGKSFTIDTRTRPRSWSQQHGHWSAVIEQPSCGCKGPLRAPARLWLPPELTAMLSGDHTEYADLGVVEALDGCRVEPDGTCKHNYPSWLLALGYI